MSAGIILNRAANRPMPKLPTNKYKTYRVMSPLSTHYRSATCEEFGCLAYQKGWTYKKSDLDEQLLHVVTHSGKRYREMELDSTGEKYLVFEPGQRCFQAPLHKVPLDRPEFYYMGRGDYRSFSVRKATVFNRAEDWYDSAVNHLDSLHSEIRKG